PRLGVSTRLPIPARPARRLAKMPGVVAAPPLVRRQGWLLAVAVGLAAAAPLAWTPFFASDDGLVHLWRIWEYARAASLVGPVVRWVPDVAYGYGAPLFTFYNP